VSATLGEEVSILLYFFGGFHYSYCRSCHRKEQSMNIDKNKIEEIDKRIEKHQKEIITKMKDAMRKSKDFEMNK
jgi:hypothetical protein